MKFLKIEYSHISMSKDKSLMRLNREIKNNETLNKAMLKNMQERLIKERV